MLRAIGAFGLDVAAISGIDESTVKLARLQLATAPQFGSEAEKPYEVDSSTFVLTAWSLARMQERDTDPATKKQAKNVLDTLEEEADLERLSHDDVFGPHTGELAVEAIREHHFVAPLK
jgi:hypothetical protein